jgi:hypothetical protein
MPTKPEWSPGRDTACDSCQTTHADQTKAIEPAKAAPNSDPIGPAWPSMASPKQSDTPRRTGGLFGRLPIALVLGAGGKPLSAEAILLLAYRSLHTGAAWGCSHRTMARTVRSLSRGVFQRAIREAVEAGHLDRRQGKRKRRQADSRGRGFAVDQLTFDVPEARYVKVERDLFNGALTPAQIALVLYLRALGNGGAQPWQLMKRFNFSRPTLGALLRGRPHARRPLIGLLEHGLVVNCGTLGSPIWAHVAIKNPALKKTALKKQALKKTTRTHKTLPSHQISPTQVQLDQHVRPSPSFLEKEISRTDSVGGAVAALPKSPAPAASEAGLAADPGRKHFSKRTLAKVEALGVDVEELIDRYVEYEDKGAANGRPIGDPEAYLLTMARNAAAKSLDVPVGVLKQIVTPNEWARGAALAAAVHAYSAPSGQCIARARNCRDPNVDAALSRVSHRHFPNQAAADQAFMAELANLRLRTAEPATRL